MDKREPSELDPVELLDIETNSFYTRKKAIVDGALIDVSRTATEVGFRYPVAVTAAVWSILVPSQGDLAFGQSAIGRLQEILTVLRTNLPGGDTAFFDVLIASDNKHETIRLKAVCGPGDNAEPVITIMLPDED